MFSFHLPLTCRNRRPTIAAKRIKNHVKLATSTQPQQSPSSALEQLVCAKECTAATQSK